jgi:hypothetical protein
MFFISFTSFRFGKQIANKQKGNQDFYQGKEANIMRSDHWRGGI